MSQSTTITCTHFKLVSILLLGFLKARRTHHQHKAIEGNRGSDIVGSATVDFDISSLA